MEDILSYEAREHSILSTTTLHYRTVCEAREHNTLSTTILYSRIVCEAREHSMKGQPYWMGLSRSRGWFGNDLPLISSFFR